MQLFKEIYEKRYFALTSRIYVLTTFLVAILFNSKVSGATGLPSYCYFYFLVVGMGTWVALGLLLNPIHQLSVTRSSIVCLLFWLYVVCRQFFVPAHARLNNSFVTFLFIGLFYIFVQYHKKQLLGERFFSSLVKIIGFFVVLYTLGQILYLCWKGTPINSNNITGSFKSSSNVACVLVCLLAVVIPENLSVKNIYFRLLKYLFIIGPLIILIFLNSRTAWIALAAIGIINFKIFNLYFYPLQKWLKAITVITLLLIIILLVLYKRDSSLGRILIWKVSANLWEQNPIWGIGYGRFAVEYGRAQATYFKNQEDFNAFTKVADNTVVAFNELVQLIVEIGAFGVFLLGLSVYLLYRDSNAFETSIKFVILVLAFFCCFSYPLQNTYLLLFCTMSVACYDAKGINYIVYMPSKTLSLFLSLALGSVSIMSLSYIAKRYEATTEWKKAIVAYTRYDEDEALTHYKKASQHLANDGAFLFDHGYVQYSLGLYDGALASFEQAKYGFSNQDLYVFTGLCYQHKQEMKLAEENFQYAIAMVPNRIYPRYLLTKLYQEMGDTIKAKKTAQTIIEMPVKIPSRATGQMKRELQHLFE